MPYAGLVVDQIVVGVICAMLPRPALVAATPPYDVPWPPEVAALMEWCWSEEKGDRPSFDLVLERLEGVSNALPGAAAAAAAAGGTSATSLSSIGAVASPPSSPRDLRAATTASAAGLSVAASSVASADDAACTDAAATPSSLQPSAPTSPRTPRSPGCLQVHIGHVRTARDVGGKPFTVYTISLLEVASGRQWNVHRRYREFIALDTALAKAAAYDKGLFPSGLPQLPGKRKFSWVRPLATQDAAGIRARTEGLESYLQGLLVAPWVWSNITVLRHFLQVRTRRGRSRRHATPHLIFPFPLRMLGADGSLSRAARRRADRRAPRLHRRRRAAHRRRRLT